jgi:hypothetical protein
MKYRRLFVLLAAATALGCNEPTFDPNGQVAVLRLQPAVVNINGSGGTAAMLIGGLDHYGAELSIPPGAMLISRDTTVVTVSGPGILTGHRQGSAYVVGVSIYPGVAPDSALVVVGGGSP